MANKILHHSLSTKYLQFMCAVWSLQSSSGKLYIKFDIGYSQKSLECDCGLFNESFMKLNKSKGLKSFLVPDQAKLLKMSQTNKSFTLYLKSL